jgi:hypothetical protein
VFIQKINPNALITGITVITPKENKHTANNLFPKSNKDDFA